MEEVSISRILVSEGTVAACSGMAVLLPVGCSSLEEEHSVSRLYTVKAALCEEEPVPQWANDNRAVTVRDTEDRRRSEAKEDGEAMCVAAAATRLTLPHFQNKAIVYIMGRPCGEVGDDDISQPDSEFNRYDDDSKRSSGFSVSVDEVDEEDSDDETQKHRHSAMEHRRLWNSLCQRRGPYTLPSSSPVWDDATWEDDSTSAMDEADSLRLWNSFTSFCDPYSPLCFQGPLATREPRKVGVPGGDHRAAVPPAPQCNKEDAEEMLDHRGFSEPETTTITTAPRCGAVKKVRFSEDVEEFLLEEVVVEDRRGPWEQMARDRCRFLRRCQEVELSIAYCLEPLHRSLMNHRLTVVEKVL